METRKRSSQRWEQMDKGNVPLAVIAEQYLASCKVEGKTPTTLRSYREKMTRFARWFDGPLSEYSIPAVREYIAMLQGASKWEGHPFTPKTGALVSAQTVANHVRVLKGFATWLFEETYTETNLLGRLSLPKAQRKVIEILTDAEIGKLTATCDADTSLGSRDLCILLLLLDTGLRRSELVSLHVDDVHLEDQWLKVMGKGQKERFVPFGARVSRVLGRYIIHFRENPLGRDELFLTLEGEPISINTLSMLFSRLRRRSGIERLHIHLLRHTFATLYLVHGGDVFTLQNILGHTTLEMTRRYVALASSHVNIQHRRFSPIDRLDGSFSASRSSRGSAPTRAFHHGQSRATTRLLTGKPQGLAKIRA